MWLVLFLCIGFFVWGVDLASWAIPAGSAALSIIVLMGRVPSDFCAGATYALIVRPYDIGDRITLSTPGSNSTMYSLVVKHIDLMRTYFITSNGEALILENHVIRTLSVTNLNRSGPLSLLFHIQVPAATPSAKITELVDSIKAYVAEKDSEWTQVDLLFGDIDFEHGHIRLDVWVTCSFPAHEVLAIYSAKSRLLLFIHAYMQSSSIEYTQPVLPVRQTQ